MGYQIHCLHIFISFSRGNGSATVLVGASQKLPSAGPEIASCVPRVTPFSPRRKLLRYCISRREPKVAFGRGLKLGTAFLSSFLFFPGLKCLSTLLVGTGSQTP